MEKTIQQLHRNLKALQAKRAAGEDVAADIKAVKKQIAAFHEDVPRSRPKKRLMRESGWF